MVGLWHSELLGVTVVIYRDGNVEEHPAYRAILPGGTRSIRMSEQSMVQALWLNVYKKIGGR